MTAVRGGYSDRMFSPFMKGVGLASTPRGRRLIRTAIILARSEEGRKVLVQARRVAATPEGRKLMNQAVRFAADAGKKANTAQNRERIKDAARSLRKRGS